MNYVSQVASNKQHRWEISALAIGGRLSFLHGFLDLSEGTASRLLLTIHLLRGPKLFLNIHYSTSQKFYPILSILIFTTLEYKAHISGLI